MALELGLTAAAAFAAAACAIPGRRGVGPRARVGRLLAVVGGSRPVRAAH